MPKDALLNSSAPGALMGSHQRVSGMQAKLHRWAAADPGRRFDDLFNLVYDPATLLVAFERVAGNKGANTPGVDGLTAVNVERDIGPYGFLEGLRRALKTGEFRPLPVRERKIPKPGGSGKVRMLGIPTIADRVVQAALKLVLEPIFEAEFKPVSYGFRPLRRAHDAIAEIHFYGTHGYRWVLDADIEACFDSIDHTALMDRVRARVKDKRVLLLVKAFLKAGVLTETGHREDSLTGTPQGGILSPLLANIALSALDEHLTGPWEPGAEMSTASRRSRRRRKGLPNWRIVRYADDFVVLVDGSRDDTEALRGEIADVLGPLGLRLSEGKTQVVHMSDGFDFLGFRIQWCRKRGSDKWYVYTFIADRPIRQLKDKIRALTNRTSQRDPRTVLIRLNQIMRGWANYFKHAVAKVTFKVIQRFVWRRVINWWIVLHRWRKKDVRRRFTDHTGRWKRPSADGVELFDIQAVAVTRYRYRGNTIPNPWNRLNHA
ncbi:group II intron reverse transcriptase/maturase [Streptomyces broussonetiae]|uniref:Group II intron reverse transcriptase/maturase n=1 Tax=Streptomyces broussonetiae TaxID=2686304 RepID=A0A6I6NCW3_9ACTN|nr:group II intron reverse transcriptase/maturase [Streptomyces broussonetiae]QHA08241.1 group II intron reverse transcriptase/maturase [Streptomyces broussonetiae]